MGLTRIRAEQISDIDYKQAVRVITTTGVVLDGGAPSTVDGITLVVNDRVLVTGQADGSQNGLYRVQTLGTGENGTWTRTSDSNATGEIEAGMIVMVTEGVIYRDTSWKLTTNDPIVVGVTALTFEQNTGVAFGNIYANGTAILSNTASGTVTLAAGENVTITGNNTTKTITISSTGGGSGGNGQAIVNGTSNVVIASANANVTVGVAGVGNLAVFSTGGLAVAGNVTGNGIAVTTVSDTAPANPEQGDIWIVGNTGVQLIYFTSGGNSQWAEMEAATSIVVGDYGNSDVAAYLPTYSGNIGNGSGYLFGNGSQLTGLPAGYANANVVAYGEAGWAGNIIPSANVTYDLGTSSNRWKDIWLANSTIYLGNAKISANATSLVFTNPSGGNTVLVGASPEVSATTVSATGNITGDYIIGNGSQLTGLPASYGNANVAAYLPTYTGNLAAGNISATGLLSATGNITGGNGTFSGNVTVNDGATVATQSRAMAFAIAYGG